MKKNPKIEVDHPIRQMGGAVIESLLLAEKRITPIIQPGCNVQLINIINNLILTIKDYYEIVERQSGVNERQ